MNLRVLNGETVRAVLGMERCIPLMREAMMVAASGEAVQPVRTGVGAPDGRGGLGLMPGYIARPHRIGVKAVTVFPGNHGTTLGAHQGMVLLCDAANGRPIAIVEARAVTAIRTAAASAVATDVLARRNPGVLAVLGCGDQAAAHLEALPLVRDFERLVVWGRDSLRAAAFAAEQSHRLGRRIDVVESAQAAVTAADVICTTTAATEPVLLGAWLSAGQHLNVVGSSVPTTAEVDGEAVRRSRYFVDYEPSARALAGEFARAVKAGAVGDEHMLGAVGAVIAGTIAGRLDEADITLFKSLGMIAEDLIAADFAVHEAERLGVGSVVDW
ncbi:MAG TPA: ornithine cyclodeaminase family protein [Caulobacteraceae bacterium]